MKVVEEVESLTQDLHTYPVEVAEASYTFRKAEEVEEIVKPQNLRKSVYKHHRAYKKKNKWVHRFLLWTVSYGGGWVFLKI